MIKDKNSHIVVLNQDVLNSDVWNEKAICARAERLSSILLKIFKIDKPLKEVSFTVDTERSLSIAEDFDLTGTKPKACIFLGETIPVISYADLLTKIMQSFYDLDSDILVKLADENFKISSSSRTYITNDSNLLRKPVQIKDTEIYFEINLSANNIVSFLRKVLDAFDLGHDELVICFDLQN